MPKKITIEPVTRVEGHGKVTVMLDDFGNVENPVYILLNSEDLNALFRADLIGKLLYLFSVFAEFAL